MPNFRFLNLVLVDQKCHHFKPIWVKFLSTQDGHSTKTWTLFSSPTVFLGRLVELNITFIAATSSGMTLVETQAKWAPWDCSV